MASVQVSEDHCWINYDPNGGREGTVEVTTDNASRRGQAVSADAWDGWLYSGGHAVLCTPKVPSPLTLMLPGSVPTSSFDECSLAALEGTLDIWLSPTSA